MAYIEIRTPQKFINPEGLIQIPDLSSDLLVDLDADTLTGATGSSISRWEASGELGIVLDSIPSLMTGGNFPTLETGGLNGHNYAKFSGNHAIGTTVKPDIAVDDAPITTVFVFRDDSAAIASGRILTGYNPVPNYRNIQSVGNSVTAEVSIDEQRNVRATLPSPTPAGEWGVYVARIGNGRVNLRSSFGEEASISAISGDLTGLLLGANMGGASPLTGSIARVQIFGREMTDQEVGILLQSVSATYGIPVAA